MTRIKVDKDQAWWTWILLAWIAITVMFSGAAVKHAIDVNTCIAAQGKYLDQTDFDDCGYKE